MTHDHTTNLFFINIPSTLTSSMQPYTYTRVPLTTAITASPLLQAHKILGNTLKRMKLWISSVFHTQVLVDPRFVQDASSSLVMVESTRSLSEDPLMTPHDSITCQSTGLNSTDDLVQLPLSEPPPNSRCHVQNGGKCRDDDIPVLEEAFSDDSEVEFENDDSSFQGHSSNISEGPELSAAVLSWLSDTPPPESFDCIDEVRTEDPNNFVDVLCNVSSVIVDTSETQRSDQNGHDAGLCVIITPPDDSWEIFGYTATNNRIDPQYLAYLAVPPFYQFTSRLVKYEEWRAIYNPPAGTVSYDQPSCRMSSGPSVFSPSKFQKHLQNTQNDRINRFYIVTALQRHQLKVAAFTASLKACLFRTRYDIPKFLENIEPQFKWIDPAEILIESFRHTPQTITIYPSHRPCSVPHIAIHESPPNDPYVVWNNSSDPQNYCFLAISSPNPSLWDKYDYQMADNYFADTSSSFCDSPAPPTPKDFSSTFEEDLDMLFGDDIYEVQHGDPIYEIQHGDPIYQQYDEDDFMVPQYSGPQSRNPSKSKFYIPDEDDEDSLPPLDDWYITIANRCMSPEEAEAVAAAAVSCH